VGAQQHIHKKTVEGKKAKNARAVRGHLGVRRQNTNHTCLPKTGGYPSNGLGTMGCGKGRGNEETVEKKPSAQKTRSSKHGEQKTSAEKKGGGGDAAPRAGGCPHFGKGTNYPREQGGNLGELNSFSLCWEKMRMVREENLRGRGQLVNSWGRKKLLLEDGGTKRGSGGAPPKGEKEVWSPAVGG